MLPEPTPELVGWTILASLLHAVTGFLFVQTFTPYNPKYGFLGGLIPDFDVVFLALDTSFPFVHRGITHTPFFLLLMVAALWLFRVRESVIHGFAIGVALHLLFDTVSGWGVMWFWPIQTTRAYIPLHLNASRNLLLIEAITIVAIALVRPKRRFERIL